MGECQGATIRVQNRVQNIAGWGCMRLWETVERGIGKGKARGTGKRISANGVIGSGIANVNSSVSEKTTSYNSRHRNPIDTRLLTNIHIHIMPQRHPHTILRDLIITTGITITFFIITIFNSRGMVVHSLFRL